MSLSNLKLQNMKYVIIFLISFGCGTLVTHHFYSKLTSSESMAWLGAQSCYLGCVRHAMLSGDRDSHEECNKISNVLYKDLQKAFGLIGN